MDTFQDVELDIVEYFSEAHDDARARIRAAFEDDLSSFGGVGEDIANAYPRVAHMNTLMGYFGETLGALIVEHYGAHGFSDWQVPVLLFRFHEVEIEHIDDIIQRQAEGVSVDFDAPQEVRPGRTGDDGLAFRLDENHIITDVLRIEAKCLLNHSAAKIADAHHKLSNAPIRPQGIRQLLEIFREYRHVPGADKWISALMTLLTRDKV